MTPSPDLPRRMINAAICAYQIYARDVIPPPSPPAPPVAGRVTLDDGSFYDIMPAYQDQVSFADLTDGAPPFTTTGEDQIDAALVAPTTDGYLVVSLRGTIPPSLTQNDLREWILDWVQDGDVPPLPWEPSQQDWGQVETGFATAMTELWPFIRRQIDANLDKATNGILVTGHSKGGALTFLAGSLIVAHFPQFRGRTQVFAFAAPVAGDAQFVSSYDAVGLGAATTRFQVEHDIVPFLPLWAGEDVWTQITFDNWIDEDLWKALVDRLRHDSGGGYLAPGAFVYFDCTHQRVAGAEVGTSALPAVAKALQAMEFGTIADAHSAAHSYLPCFPAPSAPPPVA
jgi:hypothetical protein